LVRLLTIVLYLSAEFLFKRRTPPQQPPLFTATINKSNQPARHVHLINPFSNYQTSNSMGEQSIKVFWPITGVDISEGRVVGWRLRDTLCVVGIVQDWLWDKILAEMAEEEYLVGLESIGRAGLDETKNTDANGKQYTFWVNKERIPLSCSNPIILVLYKPPDPSRLQYLIPSSPNLHLSVQDSHDPRYQLTIEDDQLSAVVDLINKTTHVQQLFRSLQMESVAEGKKKRKKQASFSSAPYFLFALDACAQTIIFLFSVCIPCSSSLRALSTSADQLCTRLEQSVRGPVRYLTTWNDGRIYDRAARYNVIVTRYAETELTLRTRFWNTVWLVINDLILGYAAHNLIRQHSEWLSITTSAFFSAYVIDMPIQALKWLNDWPVGLKLNTPLSQFFCSTFTLLIQRWGDCVTPLLHSLLPRLIYLLSILSLTGFTTFLAASHDMLNLLTLHLLFGYKVMRAVCGWQIDSLGGLWNLFRGKRWNVLRQRTDSYEYDIDQLFLGTLLFTVSAFLFPTVLSYTALFCLTRGLIFIICRVSEVTRQAMNRFPLFEFVLWIKEPSRVPGKWLFSIKPRESNAYHLKGSLNFTMQTISVGNEGKEIEDKSVMRVLVLKGTPKTLSDILFHQ
ncbi:phosphatidylinositol glycan, class Q, partial [Cryptococcus neoformans Bt1]